MDRNLKPFARIAAVAMLIALPACTSGDDSAFGPTIAADFGHSLVVKSDGTLWTFGGNYKGQLGTSTNSGIEVANPVPARVMSEVSAIAAGDGHSLVLKSDGTLWTFGGNYKGQLGTSTNSGIEVANPVPARVMSEVSAIAAGGYGHSLVVKSDGTLWTFGWNYYGQLGTSTNSGNDVANPVPTRVMSDVSAIAAGGYGHSLVVKSDGTLWTFGRNYKGQLGTSTNSGNDVANPVPTQVMSDVSAIAAGDGHSLVVKSDGTLWTFGDNRYGQLGTSTNSGTFAANPVPTRVMSDVSAIAAGDGHSLVVKSDGTLWTFGRNGEGQLGTSTNSGTFAANPVPTQVMSDVSAIAAGTAHSLVVKSDGTLWTFGGNWSGQLGTSTNNGTFAANPVPTQVMSDVASRWIDLRAPSVSGQAETESVDSDAVGLLAGLPQDGSRWTLTERLGVGQSFTGTLAANEGAAVVIGLEHAYYSSDGVTWQTATSFLDESPGGWPTVAGGPNGFVAASSVGGFQTSPNTPWVWFSADGQRWERIPPAELPEPQVIEINHAVAGPNGFLVSVQTHPSGENTLWFSEDGRNWLAPDIPTSPTPLSMATDGSGWMALNHSNDPDGRPSIVYTSVDGVTWTELTDVTNAPDDFIPYEFDHFVGGPPLVGRDDTWILAQRGGVFDSFIAWVSTDDGRSWDKQTIAEDAPVHDLVVIDDVFVAIGGRLPTRLYFSTDAEHWQSDGQRRIPGIHDLDRIGDNIIGLDSSGQVYTMSGGS